jgi:arylsulfatase A-like enzyme
MREPGIFWWPGTIKPEVVRDIGCTLDIFPTLMHLAGAEMPTDRVYDGYDLSATLLSGAESPRHEMPFFRKGELYAFRYGSNKIHFKTEGAYGMGPKLEEHDPPLLYQLDIDPGEKWDLAADEPDVVQDLVRRAKAYVQKVPKAESIFDLPAEKKK